MRGEEYSLERITISSAQNHRAEESIWRQKQTDRKKQHYLGVLWKTKKRPRRGYLAEESLQRESWADKYWDRHSCQFTEYFETSKH